MPGRRGGLGHRPGTGAADAGTAGGKPKVARRPGSLNEMTRVTRDAAMVRTCIAWARCTPSGPRSEPGRLRWHLEDGVLAQQLQDRRDVGVLKCGRVPVEQGAG